MAKKRSAQLDQEIREALAQIPKKPGLKTREQLDAEIDAVLAGGLRAERYEIAQALGFRYPKKPPSKPKSFTGVNLSALANMVIKHGPTFPARLAAVDRPHIKRAIDLGYAEPVNGSIRLTPAGRQVVADDLIRDIESEEKYQPRENTFVKPELRAEILERDRAVGSRCASAENPQARTGARKAHIMKLTHTQAFFLEVLDRSRLDDIALAQMVAVCDQVMRDQPPAEINETFVEAVNALVVHQTRKAVE